MTTLTDIVLRGAPMPHQHEQPEPQETLAHGEAINRIRALLGERVGHFVGIMALSRETGINEKTVDSSFRRLVQAGDLRRVRFGLYEVLRAPDAMTRERADRPGVPRERPLRQATPAAPTGPSAAPDPPAGTQPATVQPDTWIPVQAALRAYLEQLLAHDRVAQLLMREAGVTAREVLK